MQEKSLLYLTGQITGAIDVETRGKVGFQNDKFIHNVQRMFKSSNSK